MKDKITSHRKGKNNILLTWLLSIQFPCIIHNISISHDNLQDSWLHMLKPRTHRVRPSHPSSRSNYRRGETSRHCQRGTSPSLLVNDRRTTLREARASKGSLPTGPRIISEPVGLSPRLVRVTTPRETPDISGPGRRYMTQPSTEPTDLIHS